MSEWTITGAPFAAAVHVGAMWTVTINRIEQGLYLFAVRRNGNVVAMSELRVLSLPQHGAPMWESMACRVLNAVLSPERAPLARYDGAPLPLVERVA